MTIKEMKDFFVQERLGSYYQMHDKQCKTDYLLDFGIILQKQCPELQETYSKYLDCYAEQTGQEKEEIYIFGICDGFRLIQIIANLLKPDFCRTNVLLRPKT